MQFIASAGIITLIFSQAASAADQAKTPEDLQREAAIAEFTAKMKAANYPALFEKAAAEFNVPPDVLKGVAFAETRWEHLTWPPGETRSPENGMPRPYGIMSLMDNDFFGHSLIEAAKLIGKDPEELKADPYQNMRGGAALLRKKYDESPRPADTTEADIESWRYAIAEYCGIPEPDLKHRHALQVYEFMNRGYHQYGIEWNAHPVNLAPMREEVKRIVAEEDRKRAERMKAQEQAALAQPTAAASNSLVIAGKNSSVAQLQTNNSASQLATTMPAQDSGAGKSGIWWLVGVFVALLSGSLLALRRRSRSAPHPGKE